MIGGSSVLCSCLKNRLMVNSFKKVGGATISICPSFAQINPVIGDGDQILSGSIHTFGMNILGRYSTFCNELSLETNLANPRNLL